MRLCGVELVKVESHEDMAVFALEKAPPTDWPEWKEGEKQKEKMSSLLLRDTEKPMLINKC